MLVTSGMLYAIVPSGATLALRVLSSFSSRFFFAAWFVSLESQNTLWRTPRCVSREIQAVLVGYFPQIFTIFHANSSGFGNFKIKKLSSATVNTSDATPEADG